MRQIIEKVFQAYSGRNDQDLCRALRELQDQLIRSVYSIGPAGVALQQTHRI